MTSGESTGHLAVAWRKPGDPEPGPGTAPIGGEFLGIYADPKDSVPTLVLEPRDAEVSVGASVSFVVGVTSTVPWISYRWWRDGVAIDGATSPTHALERVTAGDDGARFRCLIRSASGEVTSREAVLRVVPETPDRLPEGFAKLTVTTRAGPVTVVVPRRSFTFRPAGATYYLAVTGSDQDPGSMERPWKSFAHALGRLGPGDLLYVRAGEYPEPFVVRTSGTLGRPIILSAFPGERVHVYPPPGWRPEPGTTHGANTIQIDGSHVWIHGFEVMGPSRELGYRPLDTAVLSAIQLGNGGEGCRILNNILYRAQYCGVKDQTGSYDYLLEGNLCFDNGAPIDDAYPRGAGMYLPGPTRRGTIVRGNALFANGASGLSQYHRPFGHQFYNNLVFGNGIEAGSFGIVTSGSSNVYAHNVSVSNTFTGFSFYEAVGEGFPDGNLVLNSIFGGNLASQIEKTFDAPLGNRIDRCLVYPERGWANPRSRVEDLWVSGPIFGDPRFVDEAVHDYRLRPGSPGRMNAGPVRLQGSRSGPDLGIFPATLYWEPELEEIPDVAVDEGTELVVTARVANGNPLEAVLEYGLADYPPRGMSIDRTTGEIRWTPGEDDGPGDFRITVVATADGSPVVYGSRTFTVMVKDANRPPVLGVARRTAVTSFDGVLDLYPDGAPRVPSRTDFLADGGIRVQSHGGGFVGDTENDLASYAWHEISGDFDARVRVTSLSPVGSFTRAGIMLRESLAPDSRMRFAFVLPVGMAEDGFPAGNGYAFDRRLVSSGPTTPQIERSPEAPYPNAWIRLERTGSVLKEYRSANGSTWTQIAEIVDPYPKVAFLGLATFAARYETHLFTIAEYQDYRVDRTSPESPSVVSLDEGGLVEAVFLGMDRDRPEQTLEYSLGPGSPNGAGIDPGTGRFRWRTGEADGPGSYSVVVRATDDGDPPRVAETTLQVEVREANLAPNLAEVSDAVLDEGSVLSRSLVATDDDLPPQSLRYSLGDEAPEGARLDAETGRLTWTPGESAGPGRYPISVLVTDSGDPALTAERRFVVTVAEVNSAPVLNPVTNVRVTAGDLVRFEISGADPQDLPANGLIFSVADLPAGASFDPVSRVFAWTPGADQAGEFRISFRVRDDGVPSLEDARTVTVTVERLVPLELVEARLTGGQFEFRWVAVPGVRYRIEATDSLSNPQWRTVGETLAGDGVDRYAEAFQDADARFFRVVRLP